MMTGQGRFVSARVVRTCAVGLLAIVASLVSAAQTRAQGGGQGGGMMAPVAPSMVARKTPGLGEKAPDFTLPMLDGTSLTLSAEVAKGPVVLILLRGFPEYQCPYCTRQFGEFLKQAKDIEAMGARVVWIYPSFDQSPSHAQAFVKGLDVPSSFRLVLDTDYSFTNKYGLRWDAPKETTYPSTFVLDRKGSVRFVQVSRTHAGRTPVAEVLKALAELPR